MLKKERQIQEFQAVFSFLKGESVIFYGTGQYTELLLQAPLEFRVIGLMDGKKTGAVCYGLPVLSEDEVRRSGCKRLILVANLSSAPLIYRRIKAFTEDCGISVYCMNGRNLAEGEMELSLPHGWVQSGKALLAKAQEYDVISFDLFDTLIARRCLLPERVFSIAERRARERGIPLPEDFVSRRREAEKELYHGGRPWYRLDDIYDWLGRACSVSPDDAEQLKQLELDTELEMARPREDMVGCYRALRGQGKRVVITSDMYLTGGQLAPLLEKCGIENAELYVSNECGSSKHRGTLFQKLREIFPGKRILHIGDNPRCDVENARQNGIDALLIPSAAAWMETCGLQTLKSGGVHLNELFAQRCFSSAFPWEPVRKKIQISDARDAGYLFFGPLAVGYLAWLAKQLPKHGITRLLFISRDGYLFYRLYRRIQELYGGLPKAGYFLTSRRCASVSSLKTAEDVRFVFEDICYNKNVPFGEMLEKAYGISADPGDPSAGRTLGELGGGPAWERLQSGYLEKVLSHAADERARYLRYIDSLELSGERIGMMNFVGRGVTQKCLQSILGKELAGFYFALEYDSARILSGSTAVSWYPEPLSTHTGRRKLAEQLLLGETVFSAPQGAVAAFSEHGKPVYEETPQERSRLINLCHQGIFEYLEDVLALNGSLEGFQNAAGAADEIFGLLCDSRFQLSEEIRSGFHFEDQY